MINQLRSIWNRNVDFTRDDRGFAFRLYLPGVYTEVYLDRPTHEIYIRIIYKDV